MFFHLPTETDFITDLITPCIQLWVLLFHLTFCHIRHISLAVVYPFKISVITFAKECVSLTMCLFGGHL